MPVSIPTTGTICVGRAEDRIAPLSDRIGTGLKPRGVEHLGTKSRSLPSWLIVLLVVVIGISSTAGIEEINRRKNQASRAELVVTQLRVLAMQGRIISDQYQIDPAQAKSLATQFVDLQIEASSYVTELGILAPGPEQLALAESLQKVTVAATAAFQLAEKNAGTGIAGQAFFRGVLQPHGEEFLANLSIARDAYHDESRTQQRRARLSIIALLSGAVLLIGILIVINERQRRSNLSIVERQERRFRSLVQHGTDLISLLDGDGIVRYQSPSILSLLGYEPMSIEHRQFETLVHQDDLATFARIFGDSAGNPGRVVTGELKLVHVDGTWKTVDIVMSNLTADPDIAGFVLTSRDVTVRNELMQQIAHSAMHDSLTGLPNRRLLLDRLAQGLARANRSTATIALVFIDLDDFKAVNDTLGHDAGDELLRLASARILESVRPGDTVARLGGDEFVVLLDTIEPNHAHRVAERVAQSITEPFTIGSETVSISISLGVAERQGPLDEPEDLLRRADVAMYAGKRSGGGSPVVFHEDLLEPKRQAVALQA